MIAGSFTTSCYDGSRAWRRVSQCSRLPIDSLCSPLEISVAEIFFPSPTLSVTLAPLGGEVRRVLDRLHRQDLRSVQLSASQPGLRPRELDRSARRDLIATLSRREMSISGIDLWVPVSHFRDPSKVDRAVQVAIETIDLAADLGRCPVSLVLPMAGEEGGSDGIEVHETMISHAHHRGVPLADHGGHEVPDGVGIGIDPATWLARREDPAAAVARAGRRLASVRLCDLLISGMRGPIGDAEEGQLDVLAYRASVAVSGYARPVVVDARQWANPWEGLEQTVRAWTG